MFRIAVLLTVIMSLLTGCISLPHQGEIDQQKTEHVELKSITISPNATRRGQDITITTRYSIKDATESGTLLKERISILKGSKDISVILDDENIVKNGVWENFLTVGIPANLTKGKYEIKVQLSTSHSSTEKSARLVVK